MEAQLNISGANIVEPMLTTNILEQLQEYFQLEKSEGSFSDLGLIFQTTVLGDRAEKGVDCTFKALQSQCLQQQ